MVRKKRSFGGRKLDEPAQPQASAVRFAPLILAIAFLIPNLNAIWCGFVLDDLPLIVDNPRVRSFNQLGEVWKNGYWPDRGGLTLYRPVTVSAWLVLWNLGGGSPFAFHLFNLILGCAVGLLLYEFLREVKIDPRVAFFAALLFAVMPIHTEATTSIVGSAELLGAAFGIGALIAFRRSRPWLALLLFALAVFSKESAAAIPAIGWLAAAKPRWRHWREAAGAVAIIVAALIARSSVGASFAVGIPAVDNPMSLVTPFQRVLTALWIQCLYIWKSIVPVHLSADYSYRQIPLVMSLGDWRAWCGLALAMAAIIALRRRAVAAPVFAWIVLFLPASNLLFPIGTVMGERLAYLPSAALALLVIIALRAASAKLLRREVAIAVVVITASVIYGARTFVRNRDWKNADVFYHRLAMTSPDSAKSHFFLGALLASRDDDAGAVRAYERAIAIFPAYSEAFHNRANALVRLGRREEAMESYRQCLRFSPGHTGAAQNLAALERGEYIYPARRKL